MQRGESSSANGGAGSHQPEGGPAIKPHLAGGAGPTYTTDDAAQYALAHQPSLTPLATPTIVRVEFLSAQAVAALLPGSSIGRPDTDLLCYVELHGHWRLYNPIGRPVDYSKVYEVFDAYTGNFLVLGAMPMP